MIERTIKKTASARCMLALCRVADVATPRERERERERERQAVRRRK